MDLSTFIKLTTKGSDEIKLRTHRLGMKKRSLLILLNTPRSIEQLIHSSVIPRDEMMNELHTLIHAGFVMEDRAHKEAPKDSTRAVRDYLAEAAERLRDFDATRNVIR